MKHSELRHQPRHVNPRIQDLKHEKERMQIAANGHGIIEERHTYKVRLNEIFDIVFL